MTTEPYQDRESLLSKYPSDSFSESLDYCRNISTSDEFTGAMQGRAIRAMKALMLVRSDIEQMQLSEADRIRKANRQAIAAGSNPPEE